MDWVRDFYEKQYAWADWKTRWADPDLEAPGAVAHVAAIDRIAGPGAKRILELGSGVGTLAAALAHAGHSVVAVELLEELARNTQRLSADVRAGSLQAISGDFFEIELGARFDVVAYFDGFGIGSDDDQQRLLRRIREWLARDGCALIDVLSPWYWANATGEGEEFPEGSGVWYRDSFDAEGSRMVEEMWQEGHRDAAVVQSLRCYAPADLKLLTAHTGLDLAMVEPFTDESYRQPCSLAEGMLYLAKLVPSSNLPP